MTTTAASCVGPLHRVSQCELL